MLIEIKPQAQSVSRVQNTFVVNLYPAFYSDADPDSVPDPNPKQIRARNFRLKKKL